MTYKSTQHDIIMHVRGSNLISNTQSVPAEFITKHFNIFIVAKLTSTY